MRSSQDVAHFAQQSGRGGLGRSGQYVESGGGDRAEGGPSAADEAGEQQPEPSVDAAHQRDALVQQVAGALRLEGDQGAHRRACGRCRQVALTDVEAGHVVGGQIDPVAAEVLGDVLEVFGDLQGGADGVGAADAFGARGAGDLQDEAADGVGGELAVGEQVRVGPVAADLLVLPVGLDEPEEGFGVSAQRRTVGRRARIRGWRGPSPDGAKTRWRSASRASSVASRSSSCPGPSPRLRASPPPGARSPSPMSSTRRAKP